MSKLTALEGQKLRFYKKRIGEMNSSEALALAMDSEQFMKDCGPFDIAFPHFAQSREDLINYAELLEKEEQAVAAST